MRRRSYRAREWGDRVHSSSVGSEPVACLWVSVAVPVHVFSLPSGRPCSVFMSKLFHCIGSLSLIQCFFPEGLVTDFKPLYVHLREAAEEESFSQPSVLFAFFALVELFSHYRVYGRWCFFSPTSLSPGVHPRTVKQYIFLMKFPDLTICMNTANLKDTVHIN